MNRVIRNVNVLDLSTTRPETLEGVARIENVNVLIVSPELAPALAKIAVSNVNQTVEGTQRLKVINGRYELPHAPYDVSTGASLLINGNLIVPPQMTADHLNKSVDILMINGKVYCPEGLQSVLQAKIRAHNGKLMTYMDGATALLHSAKLTAHLVSSFAPSTHLVTTGATRFVDAVEETLLRGRIARFECLGTLVIREEMLAALEGIWVSPEKTTLQVIPAGFTYWDDDALFDAVGLSRMKQARVFVTGDLRFADDVLPEHVEAAIVQLQVEGTVTCHARLQDAVTKCCTQDTSVLAYDGRLLLVEGIRKIGASELKYAATEGLTVIVSGILEISESVAADDLFAAIRVLDNRGIIRATEEQSGALYARMRTNSGLIETTDQTSAVEAPTVIADPAITVMENMNYLAL